jgi:hypothetical protein
MKYAFYGGLSDLDVPTMLVNIEMKLRLIRTL